MNLDITWAPNTNPDDMPAVVSYYNPSQMLEYSPEVLGITYRYEDVTPNLLHALAKQHANNFHELTKLGCTETPYENDWFNPLESKTKIPAAQSCGVSFARKRLTLEELEAATGAITAIFLALFDAGIAIQGADFTQAFFLFPLELALIDRKHTYYIEFYALV